METGHLKKDSLFRLLQSWIVIKHLGEQLKWQSSLNGVAIIMLPAPEMNFTVSQQ